MTGTANERMDELRLAGHRRSLLILGWSAAVLGVVHLIDHALRGARVRNHGLPPNWDHSGWPFKEALTPYTYSLIAVVVILGIGLVGTYLGRLWAGYWLGAALALGGLVTFVHFIPTANQESPRIIFNSWVGLSAMGAVAVVITFAVVTVLLAMAVNAIRIGRATHHW